MIAGLRPLFPTPFILANKQGRVLWRSTGVNAAAGLLPLATENAFRYFPLQTGDQILLKDPASGGAGDEGFVVVTALDPNSELAALATWVPCPGTDGFKAPPLPIRLGGGLNDQILAALPPAAVEALRPRLDEAFGYARRLLAMPSSLRPSGKELEGFRSQSRKKAKALLGEMPWGEFRSEIALRSGEALRLRISVEEDGLHCDFSGSSPAKEFALPIVATTGFVRSALADFFGWSPFSEAGLEGLIDIRVPTDCCLNDAVRGSGALSSRGGPLLTLLQSALSKMPGQTQQGLSNSCDLGLRLRFTDGRELEWRLPSGAGAVEAAENLSFWGQRAGQSRGSIEKWESAAPVRVVHFSERNAPAGKGRVNGARGFHLHLILGADARGTWADFSPAGRPKLEKHQGPFDNAEILLRRGGREEPLKPGAHDFKAGDELVLLSGSGGGLL